MGVFLLKIKIIIKAISVLACIILICVLTYFEFVGQASFYTYSSNKILIVILELINVGIVLLTFKNKNVLMQTKDIDKGGQMKWQKMKL